jgi:flagellin-like hook-associated protein FlgL
MGVKAMASEITLASSSRSNLLALQKTSSLMDRTQERLSTGKKVNSAIDDALSFFTARGLNDRAADLATVKDGLSEGINVIKAATNGLTSIESTLKQMKAIAASAKSSSDSNTRAKLSSQFNELRSQIDNLAEDASYNGVNLIKSGADNMTVKFNEQTGTLANELKVSGINSTASSGTSGLNISAVTTDSATGWTNTSSGTGGYVDTITSSINEITSALTTVRTTAQTLGINSSMLTIRKDFTSEMVNTLAGGAGDLVNADMNEEGANMTSLQTRQQLGTISLSIANQAQQAVTRLF